MNKIRHDGLWAGTEESYSAWTKMDAAITDKILAYSPGHADEEESDVPYLFEQQGSVGIISIKGPITNRDTFWNRLFGVTSYGAIREALVYAAENPEITDILLDVESNGGAVSGCYDTGNLIKLVNKIKPVTGFGEQAYSAGYWLLSSAGSVYASKTSGIGSIGVIATHMEYSKKLKDDGVGVTVFRSGQYKALVNSVEPLTDSAKIQLQSQLDAAYKIFVEHVASARNVPYDYCDANMADGKEFFGEQALAAGLVDGILSYDEMMHSLLNKSIDTSANSMNNPRNNSQGATMKRVLNPEQVLAAAAEGVALEADVAAAAAEAAAAEAAAAEAAAAPAAPAEPDAAPAASADTGVVALLQGQLKESNALLMQSNVALAKLQEQVETMQASHDGLMAIAKKSVSNMRVALGGTAADLEGSTPASILAEHRSLTDKFTSSFKAGGVAAIDAAAEDAPKQAIDPRHMARVNAALGTHAK